MRSPTSPRPRVDAPAPDSRLRPVAQGEAFWQQVTVAATTYGPLFFELAGHAMQGRPHAAGLRTELIGPWLQPLAELAVRAGVPPEDARTEARLMLAVARGLLFDLLLTGDRAEVDAAMAAFSAHLR